MTPDTPTRIFTPKLVLGLALIALGVLLTLDQLGSPWAWDALRFWPILPAAFGLARLRDRGWTHLGGHVWLAFAAAGFAVQFGRDDLLDRWWPLLVVWGGLVLVLRALWPPRPKFRKTCDPGTSETSVNHDPLP